MLKPGQAAAFDFDGVIHKYRKGWADGSIYDEYNNDVMDLMVQLMYKKIPVFILSTRDPKQILEWFQAQGFRYVEACLIAPDILFWNNTKVIGITNRKLPAQIYVDDRAYLYKGQTAAEFIAEVGLEE